MNVLVVLLEIVGIAAGVGGQIVQRRADQHAFFRAVDGDALQGAGPGLAALDIGVKQAMVEVQRAGKALEDFRGSRVESAAPQLHGFYSTSSGP